MSLLKKLGQLIGLIDNIEVGDVYRYVGWKPESESEEVIVILSKKKGVPAGYHPVLGDKLFKGYECRSLTKYHTVYAHKGCIHQYALRAHYKKVN